MQQASTGHTLPRTCHLAAWSVTVTVTGCVLCGPDPCRSAVLAGLLSLLPCAGLCYFGVSILGFWAFGTDVGDNVLLAFKAGPHHWVVTMATMLVVVHVAAAFQVSSWAVAMR